MYFRSPTHPARRGSSYLEIQVAMVMLAIGMSGLYSMTVVQSRQAVRLTQILPPGEVAAISQAATQWERKLGVYGNISDTLVPAAPVIPRATTSVIVDELDASVTFHKDTSDTYDWQPWEYAPCYLGASRFHRSLGSVGSYAQFSATGLPQGEYEILITYPALDVLGDKISCQVYDQSALLGSTTINQRTNPADDFASNVNWENLGVFTINNGEVSVRLADGPGGENYIIADAIWVRPRRALNVVSVTQPAGGGARAVLEVVP